MAQSATLDSDGDGWSNMGETIIGTDPMSACGVNARPPDIDSDASVDMSDIVAATGDFGRSVPLALARHDIAPDPPDDYVDITDSTRSE